MNFINNLTLRDIKCDSTQTSFMGNFFSPDKDINTRYGSCNKYILAHGKNIEDRTYRVVHLPCGSISDNIIFNSRCAEKTEINALEANKYYLFTFKDYVPINILAPVKRISDHIELSGLGALFLVSHFKTEKEKFEVGDVPNGFGPLIKREMSSLEKLIFKCAMGLPIKDMISHCK